MSENKYKNLIFDLDGVLIDSKKNMQVAWNKCREVFDINSSFDDYFKLIGRPFFEILSMLNIQNKHEQIKRIYDQTSIDNVNLISFFPNVESIIKELNQFGLNLYIVTSKDQRRTEMILKDLKIFFSYISCPNKILRGKPHPDQILHILNHFSLNPDESVYIGDTEVDFLSANSANINFLFADWGYGPSPKSEYLNLLGLKDLKKYI